MVMRSRRRKLFFSGQHGPVRKMTAADILTAYADLMKKLTIVTFALAFTGALTLGAQTNETTTKTKIDVKDGKDVKVTGCVDAGANGGYVLTDVSSKNEALHRYVLVSDDNFSKYVGQRVEVEGVAADRKDGKVEIKTETKSE